MPINWDKYSFGTEKAPETQEPIIPKSQGINWDKYSFADDGVSSTKVPTKKPNKKTITPSYKKSEKISPLDIALSYSPYPYATPGSRKLLKQRGIGFVNEALLGFPLYGMEKVAGKEAREGLTGETKAERISRGIGTAAGFAVGLPGKVLTKGGQFAVKGAQALRRGRELGKVGTAVARGAGALGALEALKAPKKDFKEKITKVPTAAAVGGLFGLATAAMSPVIQKHFGSDVRRYNQWLKNPKISPTAKELVLSKTSPVNKILKVLNPFKDDKSSI